MSGEDGLNNDRPSSIGIGIIKFNARTNSVCSSPSVYTCATARRPGSCSTGAESAELRFVELCTSDNSGERHCAAADSVSEADECGSVADSEHSIKFYGILPTDVPVEEVLTSIKLVEKANSMPKTDEKALGEEKSEQRMGILHKIRHKLFNIFRHYRTLPLLRVRLLLIALLIVAFLILPSFFAGLLTGFYLSLVTFLYLCVSEPIAASKSSCQTTVEQLEHVVLDQIAQDEQRINGSERIYKGWMNILNEHYHPHAFHVNTIQTVLVRLDGNILRISRPERTMLKHCFHKDPTLTEPEPRMISQKMYDLTDAQILLRPRRLARRRWFSRKYPICIKLAAFGDNGTIKSNDGGAGGKGLKRCHSLRSHANRNSVSNGGEGESDEGSEWGGSDETGTTDEEENFRPSFSTRQQQQQMPNSPPSSLACLVPNNNNNNPSSACSPRRRCTVPRDVHRVGAAVTTRRRRRSVAYIFLFARSAREKERWFHKLRQATTLRQNAQFSDYFSSKIVQRCTSVPSFERLAAKLSDERIAYTLQNAQFAKQLGAMIADLSESCGERVVAGGVVRMDLGWDNQNNNNNNRKSRWARTATSSFCWSTWSLPGCFMTFCRDSYWCGAVRNKIQTKLATIHLPYFIETLELSTLDLGTTTPQIVKVYNPTVNEWGIWCDFEVKYDGMIRLVLETRVNLMKLKSVSESSSTAAVDSSKCGDEQQRHSCSGAQTLPSLASSTSTYRIPPNRYSDEEIPESPETSPDEEFGSKLKLDESALTNNSKRMKTGQKLISLVDRIAHSKYFREATELKPIRKMMEEISSMRLLLNVDVTALEGTMTYNFPPPPSDRLWYAFRTPPRMSVKAVPQVGDRSVELSTLSEWIENKLQLILEKNLVLPNMDDVIIPPISKIVLSVLVLFGGVAGGVAIVVLAAYAWKWCRTEDKRRQHNRRRGSSRSRPIAACSASSTLVLQRQLSHRSQDSNKTTTPMDGTKSLMLELATDTRKLAKLFPMINPKIDNKSLGQSSSEKRQAEEADNLSAEEKRRRFSARNGGTNSDGLLGVPPASIERGTQTSPSPVGVVETTTMTTKITTPATRTLTSKIITATTTSTTNAVIMTLLLLLNNSCRE
uniref:SMP-LTD domain-containing protein n=1 Tax=Globodera rostochiensis TaxID=31243 RepID=A0A914GVW9_GLORO